MPADPVQEAADRLYGLPFEDFVAERDATAKALRKQGEKEAAAEVAKLPKPSQVAWVANQLGRAGADELLSAGDAIREAQLGGGGREALREATAAQRAAVDALIKEGEALRPLSRDLKDRLRALLLAVAGDEEVRTAFEAGRLVEEPSAGGAWPVGAFAAPASTPASREGTKRGGTRKAPAKRERESSAARRKREEKERKAAERARREAERKREEAERRKLERRLAAARDAADEAKQRLDMARDAYERATHEVARIEEQLS